MRVDVYSPILASILTSTNTRKRGEFMLNSYKVTSIRKKSGMVIFGSPQTVVDEGDLFRIAELHVISMLSCTGYKNLMH